MVRSCTHISTLPPRDLVLVKKVFESLPPQPSLGLVAKKNNQYAFISSFTNKSLLNQREKERAEPPVQNILWKLSGHPDSKDNKFTSKPLGV